MVGKTQEEQWKKRLKELKAYKKKHGDCLVPKNYEQNRKLGRWVMTQRLQYKKWLYGESTSITQERIDQLNEIDFVWEVGTTSKPDDTLWKQRWKELKTYKKKHGDCLVPAKYQHNSAKLGRWVAKQRNEYKNWLKGVYSRMTQERIDQLNEIDFEWEVGCGTRDKRWKQRFNEVVKYKKKHGDCLVPNRYDHNAKLGYWVCTQRKEYKKWLKGEKVCITQERIDQLNEIDFVWEVGKHQPDDKLWKQRFNELKTYKKKYGDCLVPKRYKQNAQLGNWVGTQRVQYKKWLKGAYSQLTKERINQLNEIDFAWEVGSGFQGGNTLWKQQFNGLIKYKKKHGDCLVSTSDKHNEQLGRWLQHQRQEYKKWLKGIHSQLTQERIDQLNEIDFVWVVGSVGPRDDTAWNQRLNELIKYKKKHGDCLVPQKYEHNRKLGNWVSKQRVEYKKWLNGAHSKITQERIDQLNEIDFVWDARFERRSKESNKSTQDSCIPSVDHRNGASVTNKSNQPRKRRAPSKKRRRQSQDIGRELSPSERKERRRFALQALYNWRNPVRPDEVVSV